jgi:NUMOD3 motif
MTRGGDAGWEYINRVLGPTLKRFKDRKHTEATRAQMSLSHIGLQAGSKHGMFGRKMTDEQRAAHAARIKAVRAARPWSTRRKNQLPQAI